MSERSIEEQRQYWRDKAEELVDPEVLETIREAARRNADLPDH